MVGGAMKATYFDGATKALIDDIPEEAWQVILGPGGSGDAAMKVYQETAYLYGTVQKRAAAVAGVPFVLLNSRGDEVEPDELDMAFDIPDMLHRCSVALDVYGKAYLFKERNQAKLLKVRWLSPSSISEKYGEFGGLEGFKRQLGGRLLFYQYDERTDTAPDIAWVWGVGMQEIGPPPFAPADVAKDAADVLRSLDKMAGAFFKRGAIAAHIFTAEHNPPEPEKDRIRDWLRRVLFRGVDSAYNVEVMRAGFAAQKIGSDPADLAIPELDADNRRDIAAVFLTPEPLVTGDAGGMSRATMTQLTANWLEQAIVPQARRIADAFNHHILEPAGYSIELAPQALTVNQEDERQRAQAWTLYVSQGMNPETAAAMLGLDIPPDMPLMSDNPVIQNRPITITPESEEQQEEAEETEAEDMKAAEIGRLRRFVRNGKHLDRPFTSDILTPLEIQAITKEEGGMKAANISSAADEYGDMIATIIERALDGDITKRQFESEMQRLVREQLTAAFKAGAGIENDGDLTPDMIAAINEDIAVHYASIITMSKDLYANIG